MRTFTSAMPQTGFKWPVCGIFLLSYVCFWGGSHAIHAQNCLHFTGKEKVAIKLEATDGLDRFTIEARFKNQNPSDGRLWRLFSWDLGATARLEVGVMEGYVSAFEHFTEAAGGVINTPAKVKDASWHHVAYVRTPDSVHMYLDGKLILSKDGFTIPGKDFFIGSWYEDDSNWKGCIDEVRVWSVARSAKDIAAFQQKPIPKRDYAKMLAYFPCNQGTANGDNRKIQELVDVSGHTTGRLIRFDLMGKSSNFVGDNQSFPPPPEPEEEIMVEEAPQYDAPPPPPPQENPCMLPEHLIPGVFSGIPVTDNFKTVKQYLIRSGYIHKPVETDRENTFKPIQDTFWIPKGAPFGNEILGKGKSFVVMHSASGPSDMPLLRAIEVWLAMDSHVQAETSALVKLDQLVSTFTTYARYFPVEQTHRHYYEISKEGQSCFQLGVHYSSVQNATQFVQLSFSKSK